jgi:hypothetical protein
MLQTFTNYRHKKFIPLGSDVPPGPADDPVQAGQGGVLCSISPQGGSGSESDKIWRLR